MRLTPGAKLRPYGIVAPDGRHFLVWQHNKDGPYRWHSG
jgi:hypothetical protein